MPNASRLLPVFAALPLASLAAAYSFNIASTPRQCQNLTVSITGSGGQAPYNLLIVPSGATPLPHAIEARRITSIPFEGTSTSVSFQLKYPQDSQFVAVVSDASGFGSGGTSTAATVLSGQDGCFDPTQQVAPKWLFHTDPDGAVTSCTQSRIWWNDGDPQGNPRFAGVIPGGQSFEIPVTQTSTKSGEGVGFNWTPSVRIGTILFLVGGDDTGLGAAGSGRYTVQQGNSQACLDNNSPSSTPGSPAGGNYPTSTDGSDTNNGSGSSGGSSNIGAIVGGVIGGVVGAVSIALILLFVMRRQRLDHSVKERPVDLLNDPDTDDRNNQLPPFYQPEPFVLPDPTIASARTSGDRPSTPSRPSGDNRRESFLTDNSNSNSGYGGLLHPGMSAPSTSTRTGKSGLSQPRRPVNIIQHDDAGVVEEDEGDTIELPPAYTNIITSKAPASQTGASDAGQSTAATSSATN